MLRERGHPSRWGIESENYGQVPLLALGEEYKRKDARDFIVTFGSYQVVVMGE